MVIEEKRLTSRKSFCSIKEPIRKEKISPLLLWISLALVCFILYLSLWEEIDAPNEAQIYQVDVRKGETIRDEMIKIDPSFIYLNKYCLDDNEVKCKEDEMLMLDNLIHMLTVSNDKEDIQMLPDYQSSQKVYFLPSNTQNIDSLDQFILQAVLIPKLTTPKIKEKTFFNIVSSLFLPEDPYEGLTSLFKGEGKQWEVQAEYPVLTVQAINREIAPHFLEIETTSENIEYANIIGLTLTIEKELFALRLGKYELQPGVNVIECASENCQRDFSMILIKLSKMKLKRLRIYRKQAL